MNLTQSQRDVLYCLSDGTSRTAKAVAGSRGHNRQNATRRTLRDLTDAGLIRQEIPARLGDFCTYRLTQAGLAVRREQLRAAAAACAVKGGTQ